MSNLHEKISHTLYRLAQLLEIIVAVILIVAIAAALVFTMQQAGLLWKGGGNPEAFHVFMSTAFTAVIGIEFLEMLCRHSMRSVLEVIMFAIAKTMVVEHAGPVETLMMVISLAILFLVRKYLFVPMLDDKSNEAHEKSIGDEDIGEG